MESQTKPGFGVTQAYPATGNNVRAATASPVPLSDYILRAIAIATTFVAAIVMGVAKETQIISIGGDGANVTIKSTQLSAYEYFIAANVIALAYTAFSLAMAIMNRGGEAKGMALVISIVDLVMVAFLFSANGAAASIGVLADSGNSDLLWGKICHVYESFCGHVTASIVLSMLGSLAYLVLVLTSILNLHKRSQ